MGLLNVNTQAGYFSERFLRAETAKPPGKGEENPAALRRFGPP
jgi:hypothetical protein